MISRMTEKTVTPFTDVYDSFLGKVTDDMFMEYTREDTYPILKELLIAAIPWFEFPRKDLSNYDEITEEFRCLLTKEEISILSTYMIVEWMGYQLASVENTRMKYSGADFKMTSQANHMAKILSVQKDYERKGFHLQRLYKRRKVDDEGRVVSTFGSIMDNSALKGGF